MLTRIEVDGFKNLLGFSAEFGPFTCIAGPNAVGKSNLFDAIEFLSLLAEYQFDEAAERVRQTSGNLDSVRRLFWTSNDTRAEEIAIAAEMIVPSYAEDALGQAVVPQAVCLRYEVKLRYDNGLRLVDERLEAREAANFIHFPHSKDFSSYLKPSLPHPDALAEIGVIFGIGDKVLPQGSTRSFDPTKAQKTILNVYATPDHPELLAAKLEMLSWRRLSLDPEALRQPEPISSRGKLGARGEHLPALLRRLTDPAKPSDLWTPYDEEELSAALVAWLQPVASMRRIWLHEDPHSGVMTIRAKLRDGGEVSARDFSEGTLRYLALAVLALTPENGMLAIEEPENGLHPDRFGDLLELFRELSSDPSYRHPEESWHPELGEGDPISPRLRQVIVNTHSPALVREVYRHSPDDLLMASEALIGGPGGSSTHILRLHPMVKTWRCSEQERGVTLPVVSYVGRAVRPRADASAAEDG
jgi:predicted ATPase